MPLLVTTMMLAPPARPYLSLEVRRLDLHLGDRVEGGRHIVGGAEARVLVGDPVVLEVHERLVQSVDLDAEKRVPSRRVSQRRIDDARQPLKQAKEVAPAKLRALDLFRKDRGRALAALGLDVDEIRVGLDRHGFGHAADLEPDRRQRHPLRGGDLHAFLLVRLESRETHLDVVLAGHQVRNYEAPTGVGGGFARDLGIHVTDRDDRPRNRRLLRVQHGAANLTGQALGRGRCRCGAHGAQRQEKDHEMPKDNSHELLLYPASTTGRRRQPLAKAAPNACRRPAQAPRAEP